MENSRYIQLDPSKNSLIDQLQNQTLSNEQLDSIITAKTIEDKVVAILKTVHDPEIPVNIWDLGLVYNHQVDKENNISIDMTLTAPTCPVADAIPVEVKKRINEYIEDAKSVEVNLVWEPPWGKHMMTDEAKLALDIW